MKKFIQTTLSILLLCSIIFSPCVFAEEYSSVIIDINSTSNLLLNKYDVDIYIDGTLIGSVANGSRYYASGDLNNGQHTISFYKSGSQKNGASESFLVDGDTTLTCKISSGSSKITISNYNVSNEGYSVFAVNTPEPAPATVPPTLPDSTPEPTPIPTAPATPVIEATPIPLEENTQADTLVLTDNPQETETSFNRANINEEDTVLNYARSLDGIDGFTFDKGSRNNSVYYIQYLLANLNYLNLGGVDGDYGNNTANAISEFQRNEGLKQTGYADVATQFLLTVKSPNKEITENSDSIVISSNNYAVILWNEGTVYIGSIGNGNQLVEGTYIYQTGDYYAGAFSNGLRSGNGIAHYANGDIYEGQWAKDKMHGNGKYYFGGKNSSETYDGNWVNNMMEGNGTYTLSNGTKVTGTWKNNKHVSW